MSRLIDLTGQRFGMLMVMYRAEKHGKHIYWHCKCDCGVEKDICGDNLRHGKTKSCGCNIGQAIAESYDNLIGRVFGMLTVESRAENIGTNRTWNCTCSCGKHVVVRSSSLLSQGVVSCGCLTRERTHEIRFDDLTGKRVNMLRVLYQSEKRKGKIMWHCLCDCGKELDMSADVLHRQSTMSCGCYGRRKLAEKNFIDITGQTFGKLYVIDFAGKDLSGKSKWNCICECGNKTVVDGYKLRSGETCSCGCLKSKSEQKIRKILDNYNIEYEYQKVFDDWKYNRNMAFDFYIPSHNMCIEYDGIFHYEIIPGLNNDLAAQQKRDKIKTDYCSEHKIRLLRIPYWDENNIEPILNNWLFLNDQISNAEDGVDINQ